jgi:hypothetical protein
MNIRGTILCSQQRNKCSHGSARIYPDQESTWDLSVLIRGCFSLRLGDLSPSFAFKILVGHREATVRRLRRVLMLLTAPFLSLAQNDSRIPAEVRHKSGYINSAPKPPHFTSAMLWGVAIADTRVPGYEKAQVEISHTQLRCRVNGKDVVLNDDKGIVRGGLYRRHPWFGTDEHEPMPRELADMPTSRKTAEKWGTPQKKENDL